MDVFCLPVIIAISIFVIALGFMLAGILNNPQFSAKVKEEMRATITGILLVIFISGIILSLDKFIETYTGYNDIISLSNTYVAKYVEKVKFLLIQVAIVITRIGEYSFSYNMSIPLFLVMLSIGQAPLSGLGSFSSHIMLSSNVLTVFLLALLSLMHLIYFSYYIVSNYLLVIGFAFRLMPMTRKIGATIIAISLTVLLVLPVATVGFGEILDSVKTPSYDALKTTEMEKRLVSPTAFGLSGESLPFCTEWVESWTRVTDEVADCSICTAACVIAVLGGSESFKKCYEMCELIVDILYTVAFAAETVSQGRMISNFVFFMDPVERIFNPIMDVFVPAVVETSVLLTVFFVSITLVVFSAYRSISLALGGEFFLYGFARFG